MKTNHPITTVPMKKIFTILLLIYTTNSYAQLGGLLKDLKALSDLAKQQTSSSKDQNNRSTKGNSNSVETPESKTPSSAGSIATSSNTSSKNNLIVNYCTKINSSPVVKKLLESLQELDEVEARYGFKSFFTSSRLDIQNWVTIQIQNNFYISPGINYPIRDNRISVIADTINNCISNDKDKPAALFALGWRSKDLIKPFSVDSSNGYQSIDINNDDVNLYMLAFMFDGADEFIQNLQPSPIAKLEARINENAQYLQRSKIEKAEKQREADQNAAANKRLDTLLAAAKEYLNTPNGKLVWSYQHFQIIQLCYDLRKDFAVKYIAQSDYLEYRNKIKAIENKLKPLLTQKNVDILYATAEQRNRIYQPFYPTLEDKVNGIDLFKTITETSKSNQWLEAKNNCDAAASTFRKTSEAILGVEQVQKNF